MFNINHQYLHTIVLPFRNFVMFDKVPAKMLKYWNIFYWYFHLTNFQQAGIMVCFSIFLITSTYDLFSSSQSSFSTTLYKKLSSRKSLFSDSKLFVVANTFVMSLSVCPFIAFVIYLDWYEELENSCLSISSIMGTRLTCKLNIESLSASISTRISISSETLVNSGVLLVAFQRNSILM